MYNTYTGRRKQWEQKFTFTVNLFKTQIEQVAPDENFLRVIQKPFKDVISNAEQSYSAGYLNTEADKTIDTNLLKWGFKQDQPFENNNPYKFLKEVALVIDKVSFETYNFFDPDQPDADRGTSNAAYKQIEEYLPLKISINNKEIEFGGADAFYTLQQIEYGYDDLGNPSIDPDNVGGGLYIESYDKSFELSSIPKSLELSIDMNNSQRTDYQKTFEWRRYFYDNDPDDRIDKFTYDALNIALIRIDGRIISQIDYETLEAQNLSKPKRTVPQTLTLDTLETLLKKVLPEKEKPELKLSDIIGTITEEEANQLIEDIKERRKPDDPTNIIEQIKESAQENIYN